MADHPMQEIAEISPKVAGLVGAVMEHNRDELDRVEARIRKGIEADRDYWKGRAQEAEAHLDRIMLRVGRVLL